MNPGAKSMYLTPKWPWFMLIMPLLMIRLMLLKSLPHDNHRCHDFKPVHQPARPN
jgi:hypothetical protein